MIAVFALSPIFAQILGTLLIYPFFCTPISGGGSYITVCPFRAIELVINALLKWSALGFMCFITFPISLVLALMWAGLDKLIYYFYGDPQ